MGKFVLNRNPTNYFSDVEQIGFAPNHLIPGIEASPDKVLQVRHFFNTGEGLHNIIKYNVRAQEGSAIAILFMSQGQFYLHGRCSKLAFCKRFRSF